MSMLPIVGPYLTKVDTAVTGFFLEASSRMAVAMGTPFRTLVTLYVVLWGLAMWRGLIQEPLSDGIARLLRIVLVGTFALSSGVYGPRIATAIYNTPNQLAAVVTGGATSPELIMDTALEKGDAIAREYIALISITDIGSSFAAVMAALITWAMAVLVVLYGVALILLSKVALAIVLGLGPVFIAMLLFDSTKRFFESWLGQALNYMFVFALVASAVNIMFALWMPALNYALANHSEGFSALLPMLLMGGVAFVVLMQVPAIASGLAGGVQLGTLGAVGWAADKAGGALRSSRPQHIRAAYRSARRDVMAVKAGVGMGVRGVSAPAKWVADRVRPGNLARKSA